MSFLIADWEKLIFVNYKVDPDILQSYLPAGLELDSFNGDYYLSFVAMRFNNTRVLGIPFPFHTQFEEMNLRFYVKRTLADGTWRKGVVFISEIVPKPIITAIAKALYNERYQTLKLSHTWTKLIDSQVIKYEIIKNNISHICSVETSKDTQLIAQESIQKFIIERYFGYTKSKRKKPLNTKSPISHGKQIAYMNTK